MLHQYDEFKSKRLRETKDKFLSKVLLSRLMYMECAYAETKWELLTPNLWNIYMLLSPLTHSI